MEERIVVLLGGLVLLTSVGCGASDADEPVQAEVLSSEDLGIVSLPFTGTVTESQTFEASAGWTQERAEYGTDVDLDTNIAAVGAPLYDYSGGTNNGYLWSYRRNPAGGWWVDLWVGATGGKLGSRVAVRDLGTTKLLVVAIPGAVASEGAGIICRYKWDGTAWSDVCLVSGGVAGVAIDPTGQYIATINGTAARVYYEGANGWVYNALPSGGALAGGMTFVGSSRLAVGASGLAVGGTPEAGKVHVWTSPWGSASLSTITSPTPVHTGRFGNALAADAPSTLVVTQLIGNSTAAKVYKYSLPCTSCSPTATLSRSGGTIFGSAVGIDGNRVVVSDNSAPIVAGGISRGEAYSYTVSGSTFTEQYVLHPATTHDYDYGAGRLTVSGSEVLIGWQERDVTSAFTTDYGAAFLFSLL